MNILKHTDFLQLQILFKKQLSCRQWISLFILTVGCIIKQLNSVKKKSHLAEPPTVDPSKPVSDAISFDNIISFNMGLLLIQVNYFM